MNQSYSQSSNSSLVKIEGDKLVYMLPAPKIKGKISVEEAMAKRRSRRDYLQSGLSAEQLSQMLWAAYGITQSTERPWHKGGFKTAPSAGATYPLELYVLVSKIKGVEQGVYKYIPGEHKIVQTIHKDVKQELAQAALNQQMINDAPMCLFYSAVFERTTQRYGGRGRERYVCMDLGHSAQNVYLQAEALHLGTCAIGAFKDKDVKKVMQLSEKEEPLYIMPVGRYYKK